MDSRLVFAVVLLWGVCACAAFPSLQFSVDNAYFAPAAMANCTAKYSCAGDGDDCTGDFGLHTKGCNITNGSCCAPGLSCISSQCAVDNEGASCANNSVCMTGLSAPFACVGSPGTCQYLYGAGDDCAATANCLYGLTCTNGVCQGIAAGQPCTATNALGCTYGTTCIPNVNGTFVCLPDLPQGAACPVANNSQCITGTVCNGGTCTTLYTLAAGANCSVSADLCGEDLYCAANHTCVATTSDLVSCTTNTDCNPNNLTLCICSYFTGNSFCYPTNFNPCAGEAADLSSCQAENNCTNQFDSSDSCVYNNCYSDLKKSQSCGCDAQDDFYSACSYNQFCGGFPVWAIIVIIIVAIVLVLAIVLLVFFMMRRRRVYDSI